MDDATPLVGGLDHVEFAVTDLDARVGELVTRYGFDVAATSTVVTSHRFATLRQGDISLVLTQGIAAEHPASRQSQISADVDSRSRSKPDSGWLSSAECAGSP